MTAKVASPKSSPRRGLGMQRSVKSQALAALHRGPIVLHSQSIANPHKARASRCLCLFHAAGFLLLRSSAPPPPFYSLGVCSSVGDFGSQIRLCQASAFIFFFSPPPSARRRRRRCRRSLPRPRSVYLLTQPLLSNGARLQKSAL